MDLAQIIKPEQVIGRLDTTDKMAVLRDLSTRAALALKLGSQTIINPIVARERLGSTGIGHGFALPHAHIPDLHGFFGSFARLQRPIDFDSVDHEPVDLVFLLLSPLDAGKAHLAVLAAVTRRLREQAPRLRETRDPIELYERLTGHAP